VYTDNFRKSPVELLYNIMSSECNIRRYPVGINRYYINSIGLITLFVEKIYYK